MDVAVSPYHLTTRKAPAMGALFLAQRVVTLLPAPLEGGRGANATRAAAGKVPGYLAFMNSWAWTVPLWKAGVLTAEVDGDSAVADMQEVSGRVERDETLAPLRRFMHAELYEDERSYLSAVAADLLKGGPDPGINIPVAAGLDRFATRHGLLVARAHAASVVQTAEARMGERLSAFAVPMLLQADAKRLLHAREVLSDPLRALWEGVDALIESDGADASALSVAASALTREFHEQRSDVLDDCAADEVRVVEGTATLTLLRLPSEAVLRASLLAVCGMDRRPSPGLSVQEAALPIVRDPYAGKTFLSLIVKPLGGASGAAAARRR